jgi:hypothetical protein
MDCAPLRACPLCKSNSKERWRSRDARYTATTLERRCYRLCIPFFFFSSPPPDHASVSFSRSLKVAADSSQGMYGVATAQTISPDQTSRAPTTVGCDQVRFLSQKRRFRQKSQTGWLPALASFFWPRGGECHTAVLSGA